MYKLIYRHRDPLLKNGYEERSKMISDDKVFDYILNCKISKKVAYTEDIGMLQHTDILQIYKLNQNQIDSFERRKQRIIEQKEDKRSKPTYFEINPPSREDLQAIKAYVWNKHFKRLEEKESLKSKSFYHISSCFTETQIKTYFWSMVMSAWNWQNERTGEIITEGFKLIKQGKFDKKI